LPAQAKVLDIGAGTGAYISSLSEKLPDAQFTHLDYNASMNALAYRKYQELALDVEIVQGQLVSSEISNYSQDLIICVNTLYTMQRPLAMLRRVRRLLKPDGRLFVIDFGREMQLSKWSIHVFFSLFRQSGFVPTMGLMWRYREVFKQNRIGMLAQRQGRYWLHSAAEFAHALETNGWCIEELGTCYLGDCDLAVCRPS
jgi:ubiquinone/menaquinone biosynthesis C-methylase UbiE